MRHYCVKWAETCLCQSVGSLSGSCVWHSSHLIRELSEVSRCPFPAEREITPPPPVPSSTPASVCKADTSAHRQLYIYIFSNILAFIGSIKKCKTCLSCFHFLIRWNKITKLHIYIYNKSACWCQVAFDCVKSDLCDVVMGYQVSQMMCTVMSVSIVCFTSHPLHSVCSIWFGTWPTWFNCTSLCEVCSVLKIFLD